MKKLLLLLFISISLISCEKEELSGHGNIVIGINNKTDNGYEYGVILDGEPAGYILVFGRTNGVPMCDGLDAGNNNIYVLSLVPAGKHKIEITDFNTRQVLFTGEVKVTNQQCSKFIGVVN